MFRNSALLLNADVLAFTVLLCAAAAVLTGVAPAVNSIRANLIDHLKEGGAAQRPVQALTGCAESW